jgi:hypothetical protein
MKKILLSLLGLVLLCSPAYSAISLVDSASIDNDSSTTFTVDSGVTLLVVQIGFWECQGASPSELTGATSVTWNGTPLLLAKGETAVSSGNCSSGSETFYLVNPTAGTYAVENTYSITPNGRSGAISTWSGTKATGQPDATSSSEELWCSATETRNITTVENNSLLLGSVTVTSGSITAATETEVVVGDVSQSYKIATTAGSNSLSWSYTGCGGGTDNLVSFAPEPDTAYTLILVQSDGGE